VFENDEWVLKCPEGSASAYQALPQECLAATFPPGCTRADIDRANAAKAASESAAGAARAAESVSAAQAPSTQECLAAGLPPGCTRADMNAALDGSHDGEEGGEDPHHHHHR
jgi:hypothetical protein